MRARRIDPSDDGSASTSGARQCGAVSGVAAGSEVARGSCGLRMGGSGVRGAYGSAQARCQICKLVAKRKSAVSSVTGLEYSANEYMNCRSENVIYLL